MNRYREKYKRVEKRLLEKIAIWRETENDQFNQGVYSGYCWSLDILHERFEPRKYVRTDIHGRKLMT